MFRKKVYKLIAILTIIAVIFTSLHSIEKKDAQGAVPIAAVGVQLLRQLVANLVKSAARMATSFISKALPRTAVPAPILLTEASQIARTTPADPGNPFNNEPDYDQLRKVMEEQIVELIKDLLLQASSEMADRLKKEHPDNKWVGLLASSVHIISLKDYFTLWDSIIKGIHSLPITPEEKLKLLCIWERTCVQTLELDRELMGAIGIRDLLKKDIKPQLRKMEMENIITDPGKVEDKWKNIQKTFEEQTKKTDSAIVEQAFRQTLADAHALLLAMLRTIQAVQAEILRTANVPSKLYITSVDSKRFPYISAYVTITNVLNKPLANLEKKAQFQVWDGGRKAIVLKTLIMGDPKINNASHIALVIDTSESMSGPPLAAAKTAATSFINMARSGEAFSVVAFADSPKLIAGRSTDKNALNAAIQSLSSGGKTALYDALVNAFNILASEQGRKVVLVLSDGANNTGRYALEEVKAMAVNSGVSVFAVAVGDPAEHENLASLAVYTGGQCYFTADPSALAGIYRDVDSLLKQQYKIDYVTADRKRGPRTLEVQVRIDGKAVKGAINYVPGG